MFHIDKITFVWRHEASFGKLLQGFRNAHSQCKVLLLAVDQNFMSVAFQKVNVRCFQGHGNTIVFDREMFGVQFLKDGIHCRSEQRLIQRFDKVAECNAISLHSNGQLAQIPALTGSEVTGSQFKHRYVGTSATDTVYASDLRKCKKASDVASILATAWGSTPAAVISSTASFIFDQMLQSMSSDCYKVTISSITYEVLFSYDNSYYTHCYHQTVKEYKSNGSLIRSKTDYYQAIGG